MPDALWSAAAGVTYTDAEDRQLIKAMYNPGVVNGLVVTVTSGQNLSVSTGSAVILDSTSNGSWLAPMTTTTSGLAMSGTTTRFVYIKVVEATGQSSVVLLTAPPTDPYLQLARVTSNGTTATVDSTVPAIKALPPNVSGLFLPLTGGTLGGGTLQGALTGTTATFSGNLTVNSPGIINAPAGVVLGSGPGVTMLHRCLVSGSGDSVGSGNWSRVNFTGGASQASDYGVTVLGGTGRFNAGVTGDYAIAGSVTFGSNSSGKRQTRLAVYKKTDTGGATVIRTMYSGEEFGLSSDNPTVQLPSMIRMAADEYFAIEAFQNSGSAITLGGATCMLRLIQAG